LSARYKMISCKIKNSTVVLFFLIFTAVIGAVMAIAAISSPEEKKLTLKEAREMINGSVWEIELKETATGKKQNESKDTLRFTENRIVSDMMKAKGFAPTSFTVRIKEPDRVIWETMQTSEKKGTAFWRGELSNGRTMTGVLSWHIKKNKVRDYYFTGDYSGKPDTGKIAGEKK